MVYFASLLSRRKITVVGPSVESKKKKEARLKKLKAIASNLYNSNGNNSR